MQDQVVTFRMPSNEYSRLAYMAVSMDAARKPTTLIRDIVLAWLPPVRCPMPIDPAILTVLIRENELKLGRPIRQLPMDGLFQLDNLP